MVPDKVQSEKRAITPKTDKAEAETDTDVLTYKRRLKCMLSLQVASCLFVNKK